LIFVTVGLMYGFENLIKEMDKIAGMIEEKVVMQIGNTSYEPKYAEYFRFASKTEIDGLYNDARVLVCHAGVGSILTALQYNKPVIIVPRKKKDGEVVDDHQLEIAREWEKDGRITTVHDISMLDRALMTVSSNPCVNFENNNSLAKALRKYLDKLTD
jgi:beta-1,4-N-acetylglucosaminyltransferase